MEKNGSRSRVIEAESTETRLRAKDNAANDYRRAFALIEKLTPRKLAIMNLKTPPLPPATEAEISALLEKIAPIGAIARSKHVGRYIDMPLRHIHPDMLLTMRKALAPRKWITRFRSKSASPATAKR